MYSPEFNCSPRVYTLLEKIAQMGEKVRASLIKVPWVPSLAREAMARLAWGSTAIEGCTLSLEAVKKLMEGKPTEGYPDRHVRMAENYINALNWIHKKGKTKTISEEDIFHLHKIIAEGAVDEGPLGAYRKIDVRAGLHVGSPWRKVPSQMKDLLQWLNGPGQELPAIFSSALLHLRFVEIHPFRDGNGRVTRALATWELYRKGFDTLHIFSLDDVLMENRNLYIKSLQRVQVEGADLGGWIEFVSEAVLEALERVEKRILSLGPIGSKELSLTVRQETLLRILKERGLVNIRDLARALRLTVPGVHYAMRPLLKNKIIVKRGTHKNTKYTLP